MTTATVPKRVGYIGAGIVGLVIAAGYLVMAFDLPFGHLDQPGAGVFPVAMGVVLVIASVIAIWEGIKLDPAIQVEMPVGIDLRRLLSLVVLLLGFLVALPLLGHLIASTLFCILLMRCLSDMGWARIVAYSVIMCGALYVVFVMFLKVPLPLGLFSP